MQILSASHAISVHLLVQLRQTHRRGISANVNNTNIPSAANVHNNSQSMRQLVHAGCPSNPLPIAQSLFFEPNVAIVAVAFIDSRFHVPGDGVSLQQAARPRRKYARSRLHEQRCDNDKIETAYTSCMI